MKLLHFCPRGIAFDAREAGVDDVFDARHGERGFGNVGCQHDAAFHAGGMEDFVLFGVRQACEQGQDFVVAAQRGFAQGFGGFADFAFARQEHQNIAFAIPRQFVRRIDNRIRQLHFRVVFVFAGQRSVEDFNRIGTSTYF